MWSHSVFNNVRGNEARMYLYATPRRSVRKKAAKFGKDIVIWSVETFWTKDILSYISDSIISCFPQWSKWCYNVDIIRANKNYRSVPWRNKSAFSFVNLLYFMRRSDLFEVILIKISFKKFKTFMAIIFYQYLICLFVGENIIRLVRLAVYYFLS